MNNNNSTKHVRMDTVRIYLSHGQNESRFRLHSRVLARERLSRWLNRKYHVHVVTDPHDRQIDWIVIPNHETQASQYILQYHPHLPVYTLDDSMLRLHRRHARAGGAPAMALANVPVHTIRITNRTNRAVKAICFNRFAYMRSGSFKNNTKYDTTMMLARFLQDQFKLQPFPLIPAATSVDLPWTDDLRLDSEKRILLTVGGEVMTIREGVNKSVVEKWIPDLRTVQIWEIDSNTQICTLDDDPSTNTAHKGRLVKATFLAGKRGGRGHRHIIHETDEHKEEQSSMIVGGAAGWGEEKWIGVDNYVADRMLAAFTSIPTKWVGKPLELNTSFPIAADTKQPDIPEPGAVKILGKNFRAKYDANNSQTQPLDANEPLSTFSWFQRPSFSFNSDRVVVLCSASRAEVVQRAGTSSETREPIMVPNIDSLFFRYVAGESGDYHILSMPASRASRESMTNAEERAKAFWPDMPYILEPIQKHARPLPTVARKM